MICLAGCIKKRRGDILGLEECVITEDFLVRGTGGEELEQIHDPKPGAADARSPPTFAGFDGDASEWFHAGNLPRKAGFSSNVSSFGDEAGPQGPWYTRLYPANIRIPGVAGFTKR